MALWVVEILTTHSANTLSYLAAEPTVISGKEPTVVSRKEPGAISREESGAVPGKEPGAISRKESDAVSREEPGVKTVTPGENPTISVIAVTTIILLLLQPRGGGLLLAGLVCSLENGCCYRSLSCYLRIAVVRTLSKSV